MFDLSISKMKMARLAVWVALSGLCIEYCSSINVQGIRYHYHKSSHNKGSLNNNNNAGPAAAGSPVPADPVSPPPQPAEPPTIPSDPYPVNTTTSCAIFDVTTFGAVGDGCTDDTAAFTEAWKAACAVESATILAPADCSFIITSTIFSGPCKPGLVFQVDGVLMAPEGPESWPESDSKKQWLVFYRLDDITFTGQGTIEGNGHNGGNSRVNLTGVCIVYTLVLQGPNGSTVSGQCDSPAMIQFFMSNNLVVTGLRIQNSPQFHMKFDGCSGVHIEQLSISSPKLSPNTDGIHLENTKNVAIYHSEISNGDDCISIGSGCSNVDILGLICGPSHGISIGSLGVHNSQACVSNITVRDTIIRESDNGLRIKTWQGGRGCVSGVSFENIQMENVLNCMNIDQYYCMSKDCRNQTSAVYVTDVPYRNIKGTYDVRKPPIQFVCSDTMACTDIKLAEVELLPEEGELLEDPFCWNAYGIQETLTVPPIDDCLREGDPRSVAQLSEYACSH